MYSETFHSESQLHPFFHRHFSVPTGTDASPNSPEKLSKPQIVTARENVDGLGFPFSSSPDVVSAQFEMEGALKASHTKATSAPDFESFQSLPNETATIAQMNEVGVSPAAMFLSAFSSPAAAALPPPDSEGEVIAGYKLGPIIGYGGFSTIRRGYSSAGGTVAIKIVRRSDLSKQVNPTLARKRLDHEAAVWSSLSHEHILPLFSTEHTSYADYFFTLLCPSGSLYDILKRDGRPALMQEEAGMMFRQVVRGLRYLHEVAGLVHRDIKLENVLVDEMGVCRIGDFGMTRKIGELDDDDEDDDVLQEEVDQPFGSYQPVTSRKRHTKPGLNNHLSLMRHHGARHRNSTPLPSSTPTPHPAHVFQPGSLPYAAPELLLPQTTPLLPHPAQDIWALGVLLYALLTGRLPFSDSFEPRLQMKIVHGVYDVPNDIGRGAERVLEGCLESSVPNRWSIAQVDDVAYGVGWGQETDDISSDEEDNDEELQVAAQLTVETAMARSSRPSRSSSRSPPEDFISPVWQHEDHAPLPSLEAARRRSSSRQQRSLSRAPALTDTSSSTRSSARSASRRSRPASATAEGSHERVLSPASATSSDFPLSPLAVPAPSALERGRRRTKAHLASRSRSPVVAPTTPDDSVDRFSLPLSVLEAHIDDMSTSTQALRPLGVKIHTRELYEQVEEPELERMAETERWVDKRGIGRSISTQPSDYSRPHSFTRNGVPLQENVSAEGKHRAKPLRAGSTPPAPSSWASTPRGIEDIRPSLLGHPHHASDTFLRKPGLHPIQIHTKNSTRSRSVGCTHHLSEDAALRRQSMKF